MTYGNMGRLHPTEAVNPSGPGLFMNASRATGRVAQGTPTAGAPGAPHRAGGRPRSAYPVTGPARHARITFMNE